MVVDIVGVVVIYLFAVEVSSSAISINPLARRGGP
jgi:hypothetical protein